MVKNIRHISQALPRSLIIIYEFMAGLLARSDYWCLPIHFAGQWLLTFNNTNCYLQLELTAAGTAPVLHRIPF